MTDPWRRAQALFGEKLANQGTGISRDPQRMKALAQEIHLFEQALRAQKGLPLPDESTQAQ